MTAIHKIQVLTDHVTNGKSAETIHALDAHIKNVHRHCIMYLSLTLTCQWIRENSEPLADKPGYIAGKINPHSAAPKQGGNNILEVITINMLAQQPHAQGHCTAWCDHPDLKNTASCCCSEGAGQHKEISRALGTAAHAVSHDRKYFAFT